MKSEEQIDIEDGESAPIVENITPFDTSIPNGGQRRITSSKPRREIRKVKRLRKKAIQNHPPALKYGSLVLLVAQLVGLVLLLRYSRTHSNGSDLYLSSTAVFSMEVCQCSHTFVVNLFNVIILIEIKSHTIFDIIGNEIHHLQHSGIFTSWIDATRMGC